MTPDPQTHMIRLNKASRVWNMRTKIFKGRSFAEIATLAGIEIENPSERTVDTAIYNLGLNVLAMSLSDEEEDIPAEIEEEENPEEDDFFDSFPTISRMMKGSEAMSKIHNPAPKKQPTQPIQKATEFVIEKDGERIPKGAGATPFDSGEGFSVDTPMTESQIKREAIRLHKRAMEPQKEGLGNARSTRVDRKNG